MRIYNSVVPEGMQDLVASASGKAVLSLRTRKGQEKPATVKAIDPEAAKAVLRIDSRNRWGERFHGSMDDFLKPLVRL